MSNDKALSQPQEAVANKDCSICNGTGQYCVGTSNDESDGNAPILERCECYLDNAPPNYEALLKENEQQKAHIEALQDKVDTFNRDDCVCACSYDSADDVCLVHSPIVNSLKKENEEIKSLLSVAKCPDCNGSGVIQQNQYPDGEIEQCRWCYEREALKKGE